MIAIIIIVIRESSHVCCSLIACSCVIFPDLFCTFQKKKRRNARYRSLPVSINLNLLVAITVKRF